MIWKQPVTKLPQLYFLISYFHASFYFYLITFSYEKRLIWREDWQVPKWRSGHRCTMDTEGVAIVTGTAEFHLRAKQAGFTSTEPLTDLCGHTLDYFFCLRYVRYSLFFHLYFHYSVRVDWILVYLKKSFVLPHRRSRSLWTSPQRLRSIIISL